MTTSRVFVDTNVFVYRHHFGREGGKGLVAASVLQDLWHRPDVVAVVSPQVVTEFLNVFSRKLRDETTLAESLQAAACIVEEHEFVSLDALTTRSALRASERYGLDYLDAQIWAAARISGCSAIITEDTHGDELEGVAYVNPFVEGFDIEGWVATASGGRGPAD